VGRGDKASETIFIPVAERCAYASPISLPKTVARLATGSGGLTPHRAGFAPGYPSDRSRVGRTPIPIDQRSLVALKSLSAMKSSRMRRPSARGSDAPRSRLRISAAAASRTSAARRTRSNTPCSRVSKDRSNVRSRGSPVGQGVQQHRLLRGPAGKAGHGRSRARDCDSLGPDQPGREEQPGGDSANRRTTAAGVVEQRRDHRAHGRRQDLGPDRRRDSTRTLRTTRTLRRMG